MRVTSLTAARRLTGIVSHVLSVNSMISEIAKAAEDQANGLKEINTAIGNMDQLTQQNASMVEETTAACHSLADECSKLSMLVDQFEVAPYLAVRRPAA